MPAHSTSSGHRSPDPADEPTVDLARRRMAALTAELAADRGATVLAPGFPDPSAGSVEVEPSGPPAAAGNPAPPDGAPVATHARPRARPAAASVLGWLADRLPARLQGRVHLGAAQVGVVGLVVAVGLVLAAVWMVRAGGAPGEVVPPRAASASAPTGTPTGTATGSPSGAAAAPVAATPPTGASAPSTVASTGAATGPSTTPVGPAEGAEIVVDVVGKVRHPGIAVLPAGSRVADAVDAAGGLVDGVDRTLVNLARVLVDGEQIVVGDKPDPTVAGAAGGPAPVPATSSNGEAAGGGAARLVNLNTADQAALETLPGVGPVTAAAILEWRTRNGAFTAVEELLEVDGIGEATLAKLVPHVTL